MQGMDGGLIVGIGGFFYYLLVERVAVKSMITNVTKKINVKMLYCNNTLPRGGVYWKIRPLRQVAT